MVFKVSLEGVFTTISLCPGALANLSHKSNDMGRSTEVIFATTLHHVSSGLMIQHDVGGGSGTFLLEIK